MEYNICFFHKGFPSDWATGATDMSWGLESLTPTWQMQSLSFFYLSQLSSWMTVTPNQRHQMNFPGSGKISEASQIRKLCGDVQCVFGMVPSVCMDLLESPLHYVFPYLSSKRNVRRSWVHQNGRLYTCVPTCWPLFLAWKHVKTTKWPLWTDFSSIALRSAASANLGKAHMGGSQSNWLVLTAYTI